MMTAELQKEGKAIHLLECVDSVPLEEQTLGVCSSYDLQSGLKSSCGSDLVVYSKR